MRIPTISVLDECPPPRTIGPISQTDIVRFAGAGGDFNPLHHDPDFAQASGFRSVISMGQMQAGMLGSWVSDHFGVENLKSLTVRFTAPLCLGDTLEISGQVTHIRPHETGLNLATVDVVCSCDGKPVITGSADVIVSA